MNNIIKSTILIIAIAMWSACQKFNPVTPNNESPNTGTKQYTIDSLIRTFGSLKGDVFPVRPNSGEAGLYSLDTLPSGGEDIYVMGRVVSDDRGGNIYKYITIQDIMKPQYSLKISVDASGVSSWFPPGLVVSIRCNGLVLGKYADMFQLGTIYFNNNLSETKRGYEPGRIPLPLFNKRVKMFGSAEKSKIVVDTMTIAEINRIATVIGEDANLEHRQIHSRIVCVKNAYFTGEGVDFGRPAMLDDELKIFAPPTGGIGYPQSRVIRDGQNANDWVAVATSEYANFCNVKLPTSEYKGNITVIVGWYKDRHNRDGSVQLIIRTLDDLQLYSEDDGSKWTP